MKRFAICLFILFLYSGSICAQFYLPGEYEICFDSAAAADVKNHCLYITLNDDYSYEIRFVDKLQAEVSTGQWEFFDGAVKFSPAQSTEYPAIHKDLLDRLIPERTFYLRNENLIWEVRSDEELIRRSLRKVRKCNC